MTEGDLNKPNEESNSLLELVPLHHNPMFIEDCILILNAQWPKNIYMRKSSLTCSCDELPTCLVLIRKRPSGNESISEVLGHARIKRLPREPDAAWIESVIIRDGDRGKGYGKTLMLKVEQYCLSLGFEEAVLSTHDKQKFYSHLGYEFCSPVTLYGGVANKALLPKSHYVSTSQGIYSNKKLHEEQSPGKETIGRGQDVLFSRAGVKLLQKFESLRNEVGELVDNRPSKVFMRKTLKRSAFSPSIS